MARKALEATENLANAFSKRQIERENPAVFRSRRLTLQLYRQKMGDPIPQDLEVNGCQFVLPSDLELKGSSEYLDRNVSHGDISLAHL